MYACCGQLTAYIFDVVGGALPVESTSQTVRTNVNGTKTGVPPRKALRERKMGGATQGGTAEPTS